ncbi:hypothetical protein AMELA_G00122990 [Ameiurus melas]|uniref:Endonuclease/exonuclease/phosphatase domain-containing protein n=1 Tax=Ameiurus melas TaxID=219545 RepID=A0A7J6AM22_AMEME|nr:hypothetical protein AMELA_G00122990 [Ameiurus melas]
MGVEEELCDELFCWIEQKEQCADHLMALATELEEMREKMTTGQLVGNTATVFGSATLVVTGMAAFLTGGLAAPFLVAAAGITIGAGTATSLTLLLLEKWKSSKTMKNAEKTTDSIKKTWKTIERLQKQLSEECESHDPSASTSEEVQHEIVVRILRAMAKRSGRDLPLSYLRRLLRNDDMYTRDIYPGFKIKAFLNSASCLLAVFIYSFILVKNTATKGAIYFAPIFATTAVHSLKPVLNILSEVSPIFGLVLTVSELIDNCEKLIKSNHQTEASSLLKTKANELREAVKELKKQLNELQEMLNQIPEMECHIDLAQELLGCQIYTRGTICIEYKQTQKQDRKVQKFIVLCTKDISRAGKHKSADQNNKKHKKSTPTQVNILDQQRKPAVQRRPPHKSSTKVKEFQFCLPKITMSNVRSLPNKIEELEEMTQDVEHIDSELIFLTETWLNSNSSNISLEGYTPYRVDRDARLTQKRRGGGLIMLVRDAWASDVEVENIRITPDYELMVVSIIPRDHPKGAPPLTYIHVYVPGPNFTQAANDIADFYYAALENSGGGPVFLLGDFNKCDITPVLNNLEQYVTCPTRYSNTLDLCYGNVPGAYRSECRHPLGRSDHNVIHLIPKDKSDGKCTHDHTQPRN